MEWITKTLISTADATIKTIENIVNPEDIPTEAPKSPQQPTSPSNGEDRKSPRSILSSSFGSLPKLIRKNSIGSPEITPNKLSLSSPSSLENTAKLKVLLDDDDDENAILITPELKEFANNLCDHPETFEKFPVDELEETFKMTPEQEKHALRILNEVPSLAKLRFDLCPLKLSEERFWNVYFILIHNKIKRFLPEIPHEFRNDKAYLKTKRPIRYKLFEKERRDCKLFPSLLRGEEGQIDFKSLKMEIRLGIPDAFKKQVWLLVSGADSLCQNKDQYYQEALKRAAGEENVVSFQVPFSSFPPQFEFKDHYLTEKGIQAAHKVLWLLVKEDHPFRLQMLPFIPDLVCILLHFLTESETYCVVSAILANDTKFSQFYLFDASYFTPAVHLLLQEQSKPLYDLLKDLSVDDNFAHNWFTRLFVTFPYQTMLRIFDCYISEGTRVLFRVVLALLKVNSTALLICQSASEFTETLSKIIRSLEDPDALLEATFSVKTSNEQVINALKAARNNFLPHFEPNVSAIVSQEQFALLWSWLPQRCTLYPPKRLFLSSINGFNLNTLLDKCGYEEPIVLIIKTKGQRVFGAFVSVTLERSSQYRGNGEMFLFTLVPKPRKFPWTRANQFFLMIEQKVLQIGGGSGCGLWLDDELDRGYSSRSDTFGNLPLNGEKDFQCVELEAFTTGTST